MERRKLLKLLAFGGASTTLGMGRASFRGAIASESGQSWGYVGDGGPAEWGSVSPSYSACSMGMEQSPINLDITAAIDADLDAIKINYNLIPLAILNNGHTIQVNASGNNHIEVDGETFNLLQFHFHYPSEHTVEGNTFPMEVHFVHANEQGELAVLGVFLKEGAENLSLKSVWEAMPSEKQSVQTIPGTTVDLVSLLPRNRSMFRYFGSLTTPPCTEIVKWIVLKAPIEISKEQIDAFKAIFPLNARPTQAMNRRFLLESR